jgi:putative phosphoribosyl transferase
LIVFVDRIDAGRRLADRLADYARFEPIVIGMARGGVPVAAQVAERLGAPLDVLVVRKIGVPWHPELGVGAIAEGGAIVSNEALIADLGIRPGELEPVIERERRVLEDRVRRYRGRRPPIPVEGRVAIVIDDGLATGYTARAAVEAVRRRGASRVVLAVPVAPRHTIEALRSVADEVVAVDPRDDLYAIGEFYADFSQTSDEEIVALLGERPMASAPRPART